MKRVTRAILAVVIGGVVLTIGIVAWLFLSRHNIAILNTKGVIADSQRSLMLWAVGLMLLVVVPVIAMTFGFAWHFREGNKKAKYTPNWDRNAKLETAWWLIPFLIIGVLAVITWQSSHSLDPYKPLASGTKPITIQVVALEWKWLFIYPAQRMASVNEVALPVDTPVNFVITSDAPMNSFWIPQLAGQIYAMPGMTTQLHIMANQSGDYAGSSANISGEGFAGMKFTARALSAADFAAWTHKVQLTHAVLNQPAYDTLARPSKNNSPAYYSRIDSSLFDTTVMKYMTQ